jgi:hypothetical protein
MKKYPHYLIALVITTVQITLLALIFGDVQDTLVAVVVGTILVVLIVVVTVVVISGQTTGISTIFKAIGNGLTNIIQAASEIYRFANRPMNEQDDVVEVSAQDR